ncbi:MAG: hypothetical protein K9G70_06960 [Prolixibacteraceae bacterium]|nr:hypothetical protein [Prolixibacteraceae bacterium]
MGSTLMHNQGGIFGGNWNSTKSAKQLSQSDIVNAYLDGRNDGKQEAIKEVIQLIETNLKKAQQIGEDFLNKNKEKGAPFITTYLNLIAPNEFKLLFVVDAEYYYSEKIDDIYKESIYISKENNTEDFNIIMSFMPQKRNLNKNRLITDGFIMHYEQK